MRRFIPLACAAAIAAGCSATNPNISWDSTRDGKTQIYSISHTGDPNAGWLFLHDPLAGEADTKLTSGGSPCFGKSKRQVFFVRDDAIWCYDLDLGKQERLTRPGKDQSEREMAFDGEHHRLYFSRRTERGWTRPSGYDLYSYSLDDESVRQETNENFWVLRLSTHAIGQGHIFFYVEDPERMRDTDPGEKLASLSTSIPGSLTYQSFPGILKEVAADPASAQLLVVEGVEGGNRLVRWNPATNQVLALTNKPDVIWDPLFASGQALFTEATTDGVRAMSVTSEGRVDEMFKFPG